MSQAKEPDVTVRPDAAAAVPISFLFTVKNEELNLPYSLASVCGWAREVFVVDCGSTDGTRQIVEASGAQYVFHEWAGYAAQKNWALDNLPITAPWVFILDADEVITPPLREELTRIASEDRVPENAFYVNRYFVFLDKRIRHCGYYPSWNVRFLRRNKARYEQRQVHEHMTVDGQVGYLKHDMEHYDRRGLFHYIAKHNEYSSLEAAENYKLETGASRSTTGRLLGSATERRKWIKTHLWPKLPARWFWRWVYMYILRLGILDGATGFHFCLFMAAYEHQVSLKLKELRQAARQAPANG
jgi:glycosyltransferase involved in cell wall biosynthesis